MNLKNHPVRINLIMGIVIVIILIIVWPFLPIPVSNFFSKGMHTTSGFFTTFENGWLIKLFIVAAIIGIILAKK